MSFPVSQQPLLRVNTPEPDFESFMFGSVVVHAVLLALLFFWVGRPPLMVDPPIEVDYQTAKESKMNPETQRHGKADGTGRGAWAPRSKVTLSDLGMRFDPTRPERVRDESSEDMRRGAETFDPTAGWDLMNPDPRIMRFNLYVYNTVQRQLDRESMQNQIRLTGTVKVKIWFDAEGNYLSAETQYQAIDPDFQKIVERSLRLAFMNPIPTPYMYKKEKFFIEREVYVRN
jgi:hypothetical protein